MTYVAVSTARLTQFAPARQKFAAQHVLIRALATGAPVEVNVSIYTCVPSEVSGGELTLRRAATITAPIVVSGQQPAYYTAQLVIPLRVGLEKHYFIGVGAGPSARLLAAPGRLARASFAAGSSLPAELAYPGALTRVDSAIFAALLTRQAKRLLCD